MTTAIKVRVEYAPNNKRFSDLLKEIFKAKLQQAEVTKKTA